MWLLLSSLVLLLLSSTEGYSSNGTSSRNASGYVQVVILELISECMHNAEISNHLNVSETVTPFTSYRRVPMTIAKYLARLKFVLLNPLSD